MTVYVFNLVVVIMVGVKLITLELYLTLTIGLAKTQYSKNPHKRTLNFQIRLIQVPNLTLFDMGFFEPSVRGGGGGGHEGPHHNVVVIAPMIMKFGTGVKLHVFYTMVTKSL